MSEHVRARHWRFTLRELLIGLGILGIGASVIRLIVVDAKPAVVVITDIAVSHDCSRICVATALSDSRAWSRLKTGDLSQRTSDTVSRTFDTRVVVVDTRDGAVSKTPARPSGETRTLTWKPDGSAFAVVSGRLGRNASGKSYFQGVDVYNCSTGTVVQRLPPRSRWPQYSPRGDLLGAVCNGSLLFLDVVSGTVRGSAVGMTIDSGDLPWCWHPSGNIVYYVTDDQKIRQYRLDTAVWKVVYQDHHSNNARIDHVMCSPDGRLLGFYHAGQFRIVDVDKGLVKDSFQCGHYFLEFDWNSTGICYVDAGTGRSRRDLGILRVYNLADRSNTVVAKGPFALPRWLNRNEVVVRVGDTSMWAFRVGDGSSRCLYEGRD